MVRKFASSHSLSQDVEVTTRSEIAGRAGLISIVRDENSDPLERDLDNMLRDTWADALAETPTPSRARKHQKTAESRVDEDGLLAFRLVSSMKCPQHISLDPKPPSPHLLPTSRGPDWEDDETQAETRRKRALSVALGLEQLREAAVSTWQVDLKVPVAVETKRPLANSRCTRPLPSLLVTEEVRATKTVRRAKTGNLRAGKIFAASPHEPRLSRPVLPVISVPDHSKTSSSKRRKPAKERPPPAYWRPSPELRGKCMGYALGYPSSWAPDRPYVRDGMKSGVGSSSTCHAVHDTLKSA